MSDQACSQPGCPGTVQDGYCDICGSPAGGAPFASPSTQPIDLPAAGDPGAAGDAPSTPTSVTSSSQGLPSSPLGSRLAGSGTARRATTSVRLRTARLWANLTTVPPVPEIDAAAAVLTDPQVPENRRYCPSCGTAVGRAREGRPGRTEGFCPQCRNPFSFSPKLAAGDLVGGQYEVAGCLAHGGLGWIYLAWDRHLNRRPVVLKGLLNAGDKDAYAAAQKEREFLARVAYPSIVKVYNFVVHDGAEYIVMEYVGGTSLKKLLQERMAANGGVYDPIPVDQAVAYMIEILPAFQYLHDLGLLFCDFKPDNIIQVGDALKLIDLGGVRLLDDVDSPIYGTVGYQAPEVPHVGPSVASDLYTIGRTLAVLSFEFRGNQTTYEASLPGPEQVELFARHDSLYRLLVKTCAAEPQDRFQSAEELRVQLIGVLREIVAERDPDVARHSAASVLFDSPSGPADRLDRFGLPALRVDPHDPMAAWIATVSVPDPINRMAALERAPQASVEVRLARGRAALDAGDLAEADRVVTELLQGDPWEWRAVWLAGLAALAKGDAVAARAAFNAVYGQVPGELAPKLAMALACELSGEDTVAETLYLTCARTDANYTAPAAFGVHRLRAERGDLDGAIAALDLIPPTSRAYVEARSRRAALLARAGADLPTLAQALASIDGVTIEPLERAQLRTTVLDAALTAVLDHGPRPDVRVGGVPAEQPALRDALEAAYRHQAGLTEDRPARVALVDRANEVRQWTIR